MLKKIIVLFTYIISSANFATANSFNIGILSNMLFKDSSRGIGNDFTYYTLSKQNNFASPNYLSNDPTSLIDFNQKYQIRLFGFHYTVMRTSDNFIINGNGSNGTIAQKFGTNVCELLATDNSLYLNNFDNLYYSDFSKRLQSMRYNDDLVLFYTIVETYSRKTSFFQTNEFTVNHTNNTFNEIFRNLLIEGGFSVSKADRITREFSDMINYYTKNTFNNNKNVDNMTPEEFKQVMFKIFTQIKNRMKLTGEFNPLIDTPHLLRVFDYSNEEIIENNQTIVERYNTYIKEYLFNRIINNLYSSFNKNIHNYHDFIHNSSNGFNYGTSYNKERNTDNKIFNLISTYEQKINNNLLIGAGLSFMKYDFNNLDVSFNNMLYFKTKNNIISTDIGLYYGKLINYSNNTKYLVNFNFNNQIYGYFIRLYKDINIHINFLEKIEISSSYFKSFYNINNIISKNSISNKINKYGDVNFNDNYLYNIITFYLPCFNINNRLINISYGIKNIIYLNDNYTNINNNKYINSLFVRNNVKIKNNNLYIDLNTNITNIKDFTFNIMFIANL